MQACRSMNMTRLNLTEFWANEAVGGEAAIIAARRAEVGGYAYGCARLWLAWGCPPAPGEGVNGTLVHGRRSYDRELDRLEEEMRHCSDDLVVPQNHPKPKFEIDEVKPSRKGRYLTKRHLKPQREQEKRKRQEATKNDPWQYQTQGGKTTQKFPAVEALLKYKMEKYLKSSLDYTIGMLRFTGKRNPRMLILFMVVARKLLH